jgi:3-deoxy-D-manno-octulosonic-acid transferase
VPPSLPLSLSLYAAATGAASPLAPMVLRARARRGKEDGGRLGERLGEPTRDRPAGRLAWFHGVSVGESLSLLPLVERFAACRPDAGLLVTSGTRAAAQVAAQRLPASVIHQYAPVDTPAAVARFLGHWRPDLGVFAESELWPNLILGAKGRGAKLALVSAKLSPGSLRGWSLAPGAARAILGAFDLLLARDLAATGGFLRLGVPVSGLADLKFGAGPLPADEEALARLRSELAERPVILAASTHPGEEAGVIEAFMRSRPGSPARPLLVIVPRHPGRGPEIERLAIGAGALCARRSLGSGPAQSDVYVADTLGELGAWYRLALVAVLGGSLVPGLRGHNPLEPARLGCPVIAGPHTQGWPVYRELEARGGVIRVGSTDTLASALARALTDARSLAATAAVARNYVEAADREARGVAGLVLSLLDA